MKRKTHGGFALLEALIATGILAVVLASAVGALLLSSQSASQGGARLEAAYLADEGIEAVRVLRDSGWSANIAPQASGTDFYIEWNGSTWVTTSINSYVDTTFERSIVLDDVYRDGSQAIAESGTLDNNTKKVTVTVSWSSGNSTSSRSLSAYISNLFSN